MVKVRFRHQPRDVHELTEQQALVHLHNGLLYEGSDEELAALLAADPAEPEDAAPAPKVTEAPAPASTPKPTSKPAAAAPVTTSPATEA
jgi:hypothetical protein